MRPRFFFSTARAARLIGVSHTHFFLLAHDSGVTPLIIEGRFRVGFLWTAASVKRIIQHRADTPRRPYPRRVRHGDTA